MKLLLKWLVWVFSLSNDKKKKKSRYDWNTEYCWLVFEPVLVFCFSVEKHSKAQTKICVWNTPPTNKKQKERKHNLLKGRMCWTKEKIEVRWNNFLHHLSSTHTPHKHTQAIPCRSKRRKMAQASRNDNDKGQHFTCSYTTHTEHTPSPHSQYMQHKAVHQIEKWFISHKRPYPAPYAKWSVQICLSIALSQLRKAHSSLTQHELSLHSQTLQHPATAALPHDQISLNMQEFSFSLLMQSSKGLRSLVF